MPKFELRQRTLARPAPIAGVGLHSGAQVRGAIRPAAANAGIRFVRTDLGGDNVIAATAEAVTQTRLGTVIANGAGAEVSTVEHLMSALAGLGVDNATIEIDGPEAPIFDGSSQAFVELIDQAGRRRQSAPRAYIEILEAVEIADGDKRAALVPSAGFEMAFEIEFASAAIGAQLIDLELDEAAYRRDIAPARTFGFLHEVEALRKMGLARGGTMENCLVIDGEVLLNPEGLRYPDEFVRHKALDALGDLYLLGHPLIGRYESVRGGHELNNALARALLARPTAWRRRALADDLAAVD
ncbi:MAG TPA: UDP-3-O-acyl-N-acetylglucosamine deacetylase [Caulobacteraceae bacterium]|nr:UDP-3-O-acyl-N-acetylglucosamine deacetylase [Caulobacteraceae bacterium]